MTDPTVSVCPCDDHRPVLPANPPGLSHVAYRAGTYREFRRALLARRPGERALEAWRPGAAGDLGVMMLEWWAYLSDILTFYNEQAANEGYLRTAARSESVDRLIRLLGYRPRPAIGAHGFLAALVTPGSAVLLKRGMQIQSKPGLGQEAQTFELDQDVLVGQPNAIPARPVERLLAPEADVLLLAGEVRTVQPGANLLLRARGQASGVLAHVDGANTETAPDGAKQTRLEVTFSDPAPSGARARDYRVDMARETTGLWTFTDGALELGEAGEAASGAGKGFKVRRYYDIHLAGLARQIHPGDVVMVTAPGLGSRLVTVNQAVDTIWYANGGSSPETAPAKNPIAVLHTRLTIAEGLSGSWSLRRNQMTVSFGWAEVGRLKDQPLATWTGADAELVAVGRALFRKGSALPVLVEGADGLGMSAAATSAGDASATLSDRPSPVPSLATPLRAFYDLLPVSRGKTTPQEVLGSGDARVPGQTFTLAKSPVTYLAKGAGWASTVEIRVDGRLWREVESFYGQPPNAQVFVLSQDESGRTRVAFGDGLAGSRLPTGVNNVVARYRVGAGAASPPAGKLTLPATTPPGLLSLRNPVAVGGGADRDPPEQVRSYAPRSVLTFGRAVSVMDFEALAAQAPGVTRARAAWAWSEVRQRAAVTVYVGDDQAAVDSAKAALAAAGDPNRPVAVVAAKAVPTRLRLTLQVDPVYEAAAVAAAAVSALTGEGGLFAPSGLRIGQPVFDSAITAAALSVEGAVALVDSAFETDLGAGFVAHAAPLHGIGEGSWFDLTLDRVLVTTVMGASGDG